MKRLCHLLGFALLAVLALTPGGLDAQGVEVTSAFPAAVRVVPGGAAVQVTLTGSGLEGVTGVVVEIDGRTVREVSATVGRAGATLPIAVTATSSALAGEGHLILTTRSGARVMARVAVVVEPALQPVTVDTRTIGMRGFRAVPVTATAGTLSMRGLRVGPVTVAAESIGMRGLRIVPVVVRTAPLEMRGYRERPRPSGP